MELTVTLRRELHHPRPVVLSHDVPTEVVIRDAQPHQSLVPADLAKLTRTLAKVLRQPLTEALPVTRE